MTGSQRTKTYDPIGFFQAYSVSTENGLEPKSVTVGSGACWLKRREKGQGYVGV